MEVRFERPPLWAEIDARFHVAGKPVIFSWGNLIYNPEGVNIAPELVIHEALHGARQNYYSNHLDPFNKNEPVVQWWHRYIQDENFRYIEELEAHRAEYAFLAAGVTDRNRRNSLLVRTAGRLGAPLYGWSRPLFALTQAIKKR